MNITAKDVKLAINKMCAPKSGFTYHYIGEESPAAVAHDLWFSIKKNHTRKQTIRIINSMPLDEIEMFLARWKLERSIDE